MITPVDPERNVGERAPRYRGNSSTACLEPERQVVRTVMALRASTRPRAARHDGPCASVRCRRRRHSPFAARSTTGRRGSHRVRGRRVLRGPLRDRRGRGRSAPVIITGALTSCGVAVRRDLVARRLARRGQHRRHLPGPTVVRFDAAGRRAEPRWRASGRWCSCLEWLQAVSGGAQSAATVTNRPGLIKEASCCGPQGGSLKHGPRRPQVDVEVATNAPGR
jgi:hypothetical protein